MSGRGLRVEVGADVVRTFVDRDPVTLGWKWHGFTASKMGDGGVCDSEMQALRESQAWARAEVEARIAAWTAILETLP